MHAIGTR